MPPNFISETAERKEMVDGEREIDKARRKELEFM
jgi:hypothetical protein